MTDIRIWYRIDLTPHRRTGGVICAIATDETLTVVEAAPIISWAVGLSLQRVANWVLRKGGTIEELDVPPKGE